MTTTKKILISAGHSGVFDGFYSTAGKRSPQVPPGYYEGEKNREIASLLAMRLQHNGISVCYLNPSAMSVPESAQIDYAKKCVQQFGSGNVLMLAIHNNADGRGEWTEANGATAFTKRLDRASRPIAGDILNAWSQSTGLYNRGLKESGFNILFSAPLSVLLECSFMTNKKDVAILNAQYNIGIAAVGDVLEVWAKS